MNERICLIELVEQKNTKVDCAKLNERVEKIKKLNKRMEKLNERVQKLECMMQYQEEDMEKVREYRS